MRSMPRGFFCGIGDLPVGDSSAGPAKVSSFVGGTSSLLERSPIPASPLRWGSTAQLQRPAARGRPCSVSRRSRQAEPGRRSAGGSERAEGMDALEVVRRRGTGDPEATLGRNSNSPGRRRPSPARRPGPRSPHAPRPPPRGEGREPPPQRRTEMATPGGTDGTSEYSLDQRVGAHAWAKLIPKCRLNPWDWRLVLLERVNVFIGQWWNASSFF
jgi:hypothetical protein